MNLQSNGDSQMNMVHHKYQSSHDHVTIAFNLDWNRSGVWVARIEVIEEISEATSCGSLSCFKGSAGANYHLTEAELNAAYAQMSPTQWHSRFLPVLAIYVREISQVDLGNGNIVEAEAGGAILNEGGRFSLATKIEYESLYQVVGHRGHPKPSAPFSYRPD
jgi:hypothetical protein